jgi:hypothetical protein
MFVEDTSGPYIVTHEQDASEHIEMKRYLPVDIALQRYGICLYMPFEIPPPDGLPMKTSTNVTTCKESNAVADACYDYFMEGVRWSQLYDDLLAQIADEVFHTMFHNRVALAGLPGPTGDQSNQAG